MKVYSHDLRERLLVACLLPQVRSVATQFQPSVSLLCKLLQRRSGSVAVLLRHGRAATRLVADGYERLWSCLVAQPDATLDELCQQLVAPGGPVLRRASCRNAL